MIRAALLSAALMLAPVPIGAQGATKGERTYVDANLLSIFYHELGHALIDMLDLPVFGQEEDAADTASILLIDALYSEDAAQEIAANAAFGFLDEAAMSDGAEPQWWGVHGPDLQRYYNLVCLFYGADTDARADLAEDLDLPTERAESCEEEFELAADSWGSVFDEIMDDSGGETLVYDSAGDSWTDIVIALEVEALNETLRLPALLTVRVEPCNEANAFYDPNDRSITMCTELEAHLREMAQ